MRLTDHSARSAPTACWDGLRGTVRCSSVAAVEQALPKSRARAGGHGIVLILRACDWSKYLDFLGLWARVHCRIVVLKSAKSQISDVTKTLYKPPLRNIHYIRRLQQRGLDPERLMGLGFAVLVGAVVGAKLLLFVVDIDYFMADPANLWMLVRSAGVFYGGFLLAVGMAFWYMHCHAMPVWATRDAFAPGIAVGQAVGRLGCLLAGCCYGRPTDLPWGITFTNPFAAANAGTPLHASLHPTQLYESAATLGTLGILLFVECCGRSFAGRTFLIYLLAYSTARFVIEIFRDDPRGTVFDVVSTSQFISVLLVPASILVFIVLAFRATECPDSLPRASAH